MSSIVPARVVAPVDLIWVNSNRAPSCRGFGGHSEGESESADIVHRACNIDDFATAEVCHGDFDAGLLPIAWIALRVGG